MSSILGKRPRVSHPSMNALQRSPVAFRFELQLEARESFAVGVLRGIWKYQAAHPELEIVRATRSAEALPPRRRLDSDGVILCAPASNPLAWLRRCQVPLVVIGWREQEHQHPVITNDEKGSGRMCAQFLLERGHRQFAFVGLPYRYAQERQAGFFEELRNRNTPADCHHLTLSARHQSANRRRLREWLLRLPRPVGIGTADDAVGRFVASCCAENAIDVPNDLSIVGIGDNVWECALSRPVLSSVAFNLEEMGYRAAEALHRRLSTGRQATMLLNVPPQGVVARASTDTVAFTDPRLNRVLSFIRAHALQPIRVEEILSRFPMSRKTLFNLFQRSLGRTAHEEIVRLRRLEAERLLRSTDWPLFQVAEAAGFGDERKMMRAFRAEHKKTPRDYRAAFRERR